MDKQDIDKASSSLSGAIRFFSPITTALSQADEVFSVLSNAIKLKEALNVEVSALKAEKTNLDKKLDAKSLEIAKFSSESEARISELNNSVLSAEKMAKDRLEQITLKTEAGMAEASALLESQRAALQSDFSASKQVFELEMRGMETKRSELETVIASLETKLDGLKKKAKQFADSLVA